jgi:hypothetical protein
VAKIWTSFPALAARSLTVHLAVLGKIPIPIASAMSAAALDAIILALGNAAEAAEGITAMTTPAAAIGGLISVNLATHRAQAVRPLRRPLRPAVAVPSQAVRLHLFSRLRLPCTSAKAMI